MIERWLGAVPREVFLRESYLRKPFSLPEAGGAFVPLLTWEVFGHVLQQTRNADVLVVRDGRLLIGRDPTTLAQAERLFDAGSSVVLRHAERHDTGLAELAAGFAGDFGAPVAIQLYATPGGHGSFGWHYDAEEVFILQTVGTKEYFLRENTVHPRPLLEAMPTDMQFEKETSPVMGCTLVPGDWLYVPGGFWHKARAVTTSLSISTGVLPPTGMEVFDALRYHFTESSVWRTRIPPVGPDQDLALRLAREAGRLLGNPALLAQAIAAVRAGDPAAPPQAAPVPSASEAAAR